MSYHIIILIIGLIVLHIGHCCFRILQKVHLMIRVRDEVENGAVMAEEEPGVEVCSI